MEIMITFEIQGCILQLSLMESELHICKSVVMQCLVFVLDTFKEYFVSFYSWKW